MHAQPVVAEAFSDAAAQLSLTAGHFDALASSGGHFARRSRNGQQLIRSAGPKYSGLICGAIRVGSLGSLGLKSLKVSRSILRRSILWNCCVLALNWGLHSSSAYTQSDSSVPWNASCSILRCMSCYTAIKTVKYMQVSSILHAYRPHNQDMLSVIARSRHLACKFFRSW